MMHRGTARTDQLAPCNSLPITISIVCSLDHLRRRLSRHQRSKSPTNDGNERGGEAGSRIEDRDSTSSLRSHSRPSRNDTDDLIPMSLFHFLFVLPNAITTYNYHMLLIELNEHHRKEHHLSRRKRTHDRVSRSIRRARKSVLLLIPHYPCHTIP